MPAAIVSGTHEIEEPVRSGAKGNPLNDFFE